MDINNKNAIKIFFFILIYCHEIFANGLAKFRGRFQRVILSNR